MGAQSPLARLSGRFGRGEGGSAMVEFALILPFMLLLYIGMVEGSTLISIDRKVQTVSGAVGDLVARANGEISRTTLDDYVKIAGGIMTPYAADGLVQFVSQVYVDKDGNATVDWSKRYVGQVAQTTGAHAVGSTYILPDEIKALANEQYVIVTECQDTYTPLFGIVFDKAIPLSRENFYIPRFREKIKLTS
tara:strand:- start:1192 stop:1767 length:576 start_codon:yes stop_codon:yes gene_type:complete